MMFLADTATAPATAPDAMPWNSVPVAAVVILTILIVGWFVLRYWVNVSKQTVEEIATPTIDRLNAKALDRMTTETPDEAEEDIIEVSREAAPDDLLAVVPPDPDPLARPSPPIVPADRENPDEPMPPRKI